VKITAVEPKVLALSSAEQLVRERFLWQYPYMESVHGVLDGVRGGPVAPGTP
jgi:hypothetical protein